MKFSELLKHIKRLALKQSCDVWKNYTWHCDKIISKTGDLKDMLVDGVQYFTAVGRAINNNNRNDFLKQQAIVRISRDVFEYIDKLTENDVKLVWFSSSKLYLSLEMAHCGEVILERI